MSSVTSQTVRGHTTLLTYVTPADSAAIRAAAVAFLVALTAAAAQVSIPLLFTPVPFTFQPMVVLLGGAALGARLGCAAQISYLALGLAGLPVFAASLTLPQGIGRLLGPTGGYLLSYPLAAWITGSLAERGWDRRYLTAVLAMAAGLVVIFAGGVSWLALFARTTTADAGVGLARAIAIGLTPFLPEDVVKVCIAAGILPAIWRLVGFRAAAIDQRPNTNRN